MKQTNFERWKETATAEDVSMLMDSSNCDGCPCRELCQKRHGEAFKGCKATFIEWASQPSGADVERGEVVETKRALGQVLDELAKLRQKTVVDERVIFHTEEGQFCVEGWGDKAQIVHRFSGMLQYWDVKSIENVPRDYMKIPGSVREEYEHRVGAADYKKIDRIIKTARAAGRL